MDVNGEEILAQKVSPPRKVEERHAFACRHPPIFSRKNGKAPSAHHTKSDYLA